MEWSKLSRSDKAVLNYSKAKAKRKKPDEGVVRLLNNPHKRPKQLIGMVAR